MRQPSLFVAIVLCGLIAALRLGNMSRQALTWDVFGYYLYLPATFIYDDPALEKTEWLSDLMEKYGPSGTLYQVVDMPDGRRMIKYTMGMAVAYAPFFLIAHALAEPLGFPADGLSPPYQIAITLGCLLYILIGIFLFRRVLLRFFDDQWTALLLILIVLGTNYLQLAAWDGTLLTHPFLFTLYAALLLATIEWHDRPRIEAGVAIGATGGLIALVRPPEALVMLLPLLWAIDRPKEKLLQLRSHWMHVIVAIIMFLMIISPQLIYWKALSGEWITNSYANNPGEGFDIREPHLRPFLISFRKGWFIYTPLMLLAIIGLPWLWRRHRALFWPLVIFLPLQVWIVASWTNWWYAGGSFSSRSMLPVYVLLAIPLGALLQWISLQKIRPITYAGVGALVFLNLFQTWQWKEGIISKERMTRAYYFATFGRTSVPPGAEDLLLIDRPTTADETFNNDPHYHSRTIFDERYDPPRILTAQDAFLPGPELEFQAITSTDHAWIRATATLRADSLIRPPVMVMTFHHDGKTYKYRSASWKIGSSDDEWVELQMDYLTPEVRSRNDLFKAYIWNMHGDTSAIGSFRVEVFER